MRVNFFEEFPTKENLDKVTLLSFPITLYIAAHSLAEFQEHSAYIHSLNPQITCVYWYLAPYSYWISPFSNTEDLENISKELVTISQSTPVMLDLELPVLRGKRHLFFNIFSLRKNKRIIRDLIQYLSQKGNCYVAEYPPTGRTLEWIYDLLGLSYPGLPYTRILMMYSSMVNRMILQKIQRYISTLEKDTRKLSLGFGTIAVGILGTEPILSPEKLKEDLLFALKNNIDSVVIFRLGGITEEYVRIISEIQ